MNVKVPQCGRTDMWAENTMPNHNAYLKQAGGDTQTVRPAVIHYI